MLPELTLAFSGLAMGLVGGPHCLAMCTAPCSLVVGTSNRVTLGARATGTAEPPAQRMLGFQLGRLAGYTAMGAVAAASLDALGWLTVQSAAFRPVWTMFHATALVIGLMLLVLARQPLWIESGARRVWSWARTTATAGTSGLSPGTPRRPPVWVMGAAWALLPCGLLYSALLVAAMSGNAWRGAIVMASFSVGSGLWLAAGPWVLGRLRTWRGDGLGIRLGGACLVLVSATALWLALMHDQAPWCVTR